MCSNPVVLIFSEGKCLPEDVAKSIINENSTTDYKIINLDLKCQSKTIGLTMNLSNKYFTTELLLVPMSENINTVPPNLVKAAEAVLVYFDSNDRNFLIKIADYNNFLTNNNIELGVVICETLHNDTKDGITYAEIKSEGIVLDVVELADTCTTSTEAKGYSEIYEIFNNFIWSNIKKNDITASPITNERSTIENEKSTTLPIGSEKSANSCNSVNETEFKMFEQLLADVLSFRNFSEILPREERVIYAEQFAKKFEPLLEELCSDEES